MNMFDRKLFSRSIAFGFFAFAAALPSLAQTKPQGLTPQPNQTDSALTAEVRKVFLSISDNTLKAAKEMPEESYGFKPAGATRTFGELVAHIANVQSTLCANMNGDKAAKTPAVNQSKDSIVAAFTSSIGSCHAVFDELSAENINTMVDTPSGKLTHLAALVYIVTHESEEYGQLSIYLRIKNLEPPTHDDAKGMP